MSSARSWSSNNPSITGCMDSFASCFNSLPPCGACVDQTRRRIRRKKPTGLIYLSPEEIQKLVQSRTTSLRQSVRGSITSHGRSSSGFHELPGGHVSRGSIGGDSISIIFDLATPEMIANQAARNLSDDPDTSHRSDWPDENKSVFQISGTGWLQPSTTFSAPLDMDRNDLQFTLSFGNGWFGWIVQGVYRKQFDADGDVGLGEDVVVQILKEEATMEEEIGFREISTASRLAEGHTNVLKLVGSCFDAIPRLHVYEYCQMGDLKTFMVDNKDRIGMFNTKGFVLKFCQGITSGLAHLHKHDFVLNDLAARCCQVTPEMVVKIGDYGTATTTHLEDYVPVNGDNCPVRWISPEILRILDGGEGEVVWTKEANIWSLAVTLWEVMTFGERPFDQLSDFRFVDSALKETDELVGKIGKFRARDMPGEAVESVIGLCLKVNPADRPGCERVDSYLTDFSEIVTTQHREPVTPTSLGGGGGGLADDCLSIISSESTYL